MLWFVGGFFSVGWGIEVLGFDRGVGVIGRRVR